MDATSLGVVDAAAVFWGAAKFVPWLLSLFFSLAGAFAWYEGRRSANSTTGNDKIPLAVGVVVWISVLLVNYQLGGSSWMALAFGVTLCVLGIAAGILGSWVLVLAALAVVACWFTWPSPKYYAIAVKELATDRGSELVSQVSTLWNGTEVAPAIEKPEQSPEVVQLMKCGMDAAGRENWSEAIASFRKAYGVSPNYPEAVFDLALAHDRAGNHLVATCWYQALLRLDPPSQVRTATEERLASLCEELRSALSTLTSAALEISAAEVGGHKWENLQTIALAQAEFGDAPHAMETLEKLRQIDPSDQNWSGSCLLVGHSFLDQGFVEPAESLAQRIQSRHSAQLRQRISQVREMGTAAVGGGSFTTLSDVEAVQRWGEYADSIPNSTHHRWHAFDLFYIDTSIVPVPSPEMGIASYIAGLQSRKEYRASALMDGVKRLYLTHREIRRRGSKSSLQIVSSGKLPTLSEIVDKQKQLLEQIKKSANPGTFIE